MRTVCLNSTSFVPTGDADLLRRLTGHLLARMQELEVLGMTAEGSLPDGLVTIRFTRRDNAEAARWLEQERQVRAAYDVGTDAIRMQVTPKVTFEDLDYVQAAVMELLYP